MTATLLVGDVQTRIKEIPDKSVDALITSSPFLALRKYGPDTEREMGSEANPAAFIDALLELCAQFRRVLAPHGSIAIELGDTYSGSGGAGGDYNEDGLRAGQAKFRQTKASADLPGRGGYHGGKSTPPGVVQISGGNGWPLSKSLAGVPEAFMLSLAYGWNVLHRNPADSPAGRWRVRNVIVWARPNPPVGALGDKVRPATSYITVACTSGSRYFDLDAVRNQPKPSSVEREKYGPPGGREADRNGAGRKDKNEAWINDPAGAPPLDWWEDDDPTGHATLVLPTQPFRGSHYAVWPSTLAKRLIEMLCPLRVCTVCGEPSRRIVGDAEYVQSRSCGAPATLHMRDGEGDASVIRNAPTLGWTDCGCFCPASHVDTPYLCNHHWRPGHVLDPFCGSGTTLAVAQGCGRDATGIELYEANAALVQERLGMFLDRID